MRSWIIVLAACGGAHKATAPAGADFDCRDRMASYTVAHHMEADEIGVELDCKTAGPRIVRWRVDKQGTRQEDAHSLTTVQFENTWKEIDGTGWANMKDCTNGSGGKHDPVYQFDIRDDQNQAQFTCQSVRMPYPYNGLVDPLDLAAAGGKQLGDDEPADLKALDAKKAKQQ
ncbi:MAG TPA: hypothetical protein VGM88_29750 [Kofleriaceae bacterium]|jgi:hypothetical protein